MGPEPTAGQGVGGRARLEDTVGGRAEGDVQLVGQTASPVSGEDAVQRTPGRSPEAPQVHSEWRT